jgi:hypothetical protein
MELFFSSGYIGAVGKPWDRWERIFLTENKTEEIVISS